MKTLVALFKIRIANTFSLSKFLKKRKIELIGILLLAIYVIISLFSTIFMSANNIAKTLVQYNLITYMPVLFFIGSSFMIFMVTADSAKGNMFNSTDNDLLLSMPIRPSTILASRLIFVILWNLLISFAIMLPTFITYILNTHVTLGFYLYALFIVLLLPIIPTILASIIGYIVAYLTSKSNIKNWFEIFISLIIMAAIFFIIYKGNDIINYVVIHNAELNSILKWGFYPVYLVLEMLQDNNYLSLIIFIILNIVLFIIFIYILSINFKKIIAKLQENRTRSNFVMKALHSESISKTLFNKEVKRYFSSPIYVFNTLFGPVMILLVAVASIFYDKSKIMSVIGVSGGEDMLFSFLVAGVMLITFFTNTTSSSISIEGRNFWIMKTLPIHSRDIFNGKMKLNLVLILPVAYLSLIIFYFTLGLTIIQLITLLILTLLAALVAVQFGLLINLKFPKMDAVNDTVVVKQSISSMISIMVPLVTIMVLSSIYAGLKDVIDFNILLGIVVIILIILNFIEHHLLSTWGENRFRKIA
jgi:ABC-2 type transport system permease protein